MRSLFVASLFVLALAVGFVPAADIVVSEDPVAVGSFAELSVKLADGEAVTWDVYPDPTKVVERGDGTLYFSGPGGKYKTTATVYSIVNGKIKVAKTVKYVTLTGCEPPAPMPPAPPGPNPPPVPPVVGVPKKFVVVEDTSAVGQWRGDILGNPKLASWYTATFGSGVHHRLIDVNADGDDAAALAYKKLAAGKPLPYLWILDDAGKVIKDQKCPTDSVDSFIAAFDTHQGKRALGAKLAKPKLKWAKFGESPSVPLIPRDKWKSVDLGAFLPPVYDQDGIGQCASSSACTVFEAGRSQAGLPYVHVSAGDLYARVNGGVDQGSLPEDNLNELITNGVAPASMVAYVWDGRRPASDAATVAGRKPNRIVEAYLCDTFDAMGSALQQGFVIQEAIAWYDNFDVDSDGWLPQRGGGNSGGHALAGFGLAQRNGTWGIKTRNSWGTSWGNSRDGSLGAGNCVIPETLFNGPNFGSVWAVRAVYQSGSNFPVPKVSRRTFDPFDSERLVLKP